MTAPYSSLRFARNNAVVEVLVSVGFSFVTGGSSLYRLLFCGPKFVYYIWEIKKLENLMKANGIKKLERGAIEFVAPLTLGVVVGLPVDGLANIVNAGVPSPPQDNSVTLSAVELIVGAHGGAVEAVQEFGTSGLTPPNLFDAAISHTDDAWNLSPLDNPNFEAVISPMHHEGERLHELANSVRHGTGFNAHYPHDVGKGVMAAYLEEFTSDSIERQLGPLARTPNLVEVDCLTRGDRILRYLSMSCRICKVAISLLRSLKTLALGLQI
ncbi:hypothetical protein FS837_001894 [Tulasnella sp. UAMH 9824]|nr:hypothetical protein FS837_001894 [Tulasnella sp. UAMH 9824]